MFGFTNANDTHFKATDTGLPPEGSRIQMSYSHRLGQKSVVINGNDIDFSTKPEKRYHYIITGYETGPQGAISKIFADFETDQSFGKVAFTRQF